MSFLSLNWATVSFNVMNPENPAEIGFLNERGTGVHPNLTGGGLFITLTRAGAWLPMTR